MLGFVHQGGELGDLGPELVGDLTPLDLRAVGVLLGEGGGDEGGDDAPTLAAGMGQQVAGEVHAASLPGGAEDDRMCRTVRRRACINGGVHKCTGAAGTATASPVRAVSLSNQSRPERDAE